MSTWTWVPYHGTKWTRNTQSPGRTVGPLMIYLLKEYLSRVYLLPLYLSQCYVVESVRYSSKAKKIACLIAKRVKSFFYEWGSIADESQRQMCSAGDEASSTACRLGRNTVKHLWVSSVSTTENSHRFRRLKRTPRYLDLSNDVSPFTIWWL